MDFDKLLAR